MRRVLVIGSGGAGKSTLSRRLGERLGLEVIHLDAAYWRPGRVETPKDYSKRSRRKVLALLELYGGDKRLVHLRSSAEAERFLKQSEGDAAV